MIDYLFKKVSIDKKDLYFVIKRDIFSVKDTMYSLKVKPIALFVKEDEDFTCLPLVEEDLNLEPIIDAFIEEFNF